MCDRTYPPTPHSVVYGVGLVSLLPVHVGPIFCPEAYFRAKNLFNLPKLKMGRSNRGGNPGDISEEVRQKLEALMPQDMWMYKYAKLVLSARYKTFKTGNKYVPPTRPPMPQVACKSTRYILSCAGGAYGNLKYEFDGIPESHKRLFSELL